MHVTNTIATPAPTPTIPLSTPAAAPAGPVESAELGLELQRLQVEQVRIERQRAEDLARMRPMQDFD